MTATDRAAALWIARTWAESDLDCDSRTLAVALLAAEAERERLAALVESLEANAVRMREYRLYLEGVPTDGKGNPLCSQLFGRLPTVKRCMRAIGHEGEHSNKAPTDTERHDG